MVRSPSPHSSSADIVRVPSPDPDVDDLTIALDELRLAQARVDRILTRLRFRTSYLPIAVPAAVLPATWVSPLRRPSSFERFSFQFGDSVRINRPSRNQQPEGHIIGLTPSGFIQIRTPDQSVILRQPHNVTFLERP